MASDPHSRLVAFLKVALPLVALALLSTMFLVSSRIEPGDSIPFADGEVAERIRGEQVTGPLFSGVTDGGDKLNFTAEQLVTAENGPKRAQLPTAQLDFASGGSVHLEADQGEVDLEGDIATMSGNVVIDSSTGYVMRSDTITSRLSRLEVISPAEVRATGPAGTLTAGSMRIGEKGEDNGVQLLFTDGVKLVYDPKETE